VPGGIAVADVAREAEVSEQTVYNYFPTKDQRAHGSHRRSVDDDYLCRWAPVPPVIVLPEQQIAAHGSLP